MRFKDILRTTSEPKIAFYAILAILSIALTAYLLLITPLMNKLKADKESILYLENELDFLLSTQAGSTDKIPTSLELPQALGFVKEYLGIKGIAVEEIIITQSSGHELEGFNQALIKIKVSGDRLLIVRTIGEIIEQSSFPFILQEIDIGNKNTEVGLNILYRKN